MTDDRNLLRKPVPRGPAGVRGPINEPEIDGPYVQWQSADGTYDDPALLQNLLGPEGPSGNAQNFTTRTVAGASTISAGVEFIRTGGLTVVGTGAKWYIRAADAGAAGAEGFSSNGGTVWWTPDYEPDVILNGDVVLYHPLTPSADHHVSTIIAVGYGAGDSLAPISSTEYLTLVGFQAGTALTTQNHVTAVGAFALAGYTTAGDLGMTAIGVDSLRNLTSGTQNTAVGEHSLTTSTNSSFCTAIGFNALLNVTGGDYNTAVGWAAGGGAVGAFTGENNVAIGAGALSSITGDPDFNTAVGAFSGSTLTNGDANIFVGYLAGSNVTTGGNNVIIGTNKALPTAATSNYLIVHDYISGDSGGLTVTPPLITTPKLVAGLTAASAAITGARSFVTDANSTTFGATAVGGGSNKVPVWCDGALWKIG